MSGKGKNSRPGILNALRVGFFLASRQIRRTSRWTNILVICIMVLTFLNLVVVTGILVGLVEGVVEAVRNYHLGDIFISNLEDHSYIEQSQKIIGIASSLPGVENLTARYLESGVIDADYKIIPDPKETRKRIGTSFAGIDPVSEEKATHLSKLIIEGEYLKPDDYDKILVGALLLRRYLDMESPAFPVLDYDVGVGSKVQIELGGFKREVTIKGVLKSKVDEIDRRVFFVDKQFRNLINRFDYNVDEISLRLSPETDPILVKNLLVAQGVNKLAKVQTQEDAEPKFVKDLKETFATLGNIISSIGLVVASITIFIVVFINAITRRKYIGIMKGIGIDTLSIEFAYVFQSLFYAIIGTILGSGIIFLILEPYIRRNPIDFPFSNGVLVVSISGTLVRILILTLATFVAGYIPAKLITRQNTVDAILNR